MKRKQAHLEVSYRVMPSNPLQSSLAIGLTVFGSKIQSITPLEREYGALLGLQYYDLCDEIIHAKPSPLLNYRDSQLEPLISNYNVNKAQSKAVKSAIDNDAFTLIQGYVFFLSHSIKVITKFCTDRQVRERQRRLLPSWGRSCQIPFVTVVQPFMSRAKRAPTPPRKSCLFVHRVMLQWMNWFCVSRTASKP